MGVLGQKCNYKNMAANRHRQLLKRIIRKYLRGKANPAETAFVESYYDHFGDGSQLQASMDASEAGVVDERLWGKIGARIVELEMERQKTGYVGWLRAAVVVGVLAFGGYFYIHVKRPVPDAVAAVHDLKPGRTGALLTFRNKRSSILLDTARIGDLGGGVSKGEERAKVVSAAGDEVLYATLSTPAGRTQAVELPDGSVAWLNASSSISFPTRFDGNTRSVSTTGEVDLEVKHNKNQPFVVRSAGQEWEVLGTEFDINAYADETSIRTTLIEGAVRTAGVTLRSGEQAAVNRTTNMLRSVGQVNAEDVIAWKKGVFVFGGAKDLREVMREMARWYNVTIEYRGDVPDVEINGRCDRNVNASEAIRILAYTTGLQFRIEDRKIVVSGGGVKK